MSKSDEIVPIASIGILGTHESADSSAQTVVVDQEPVTNVVYRGSNINTANSRKSDLARVSVIIRYSKPGTIEQAVESVLAQDYPIDLVEILGVGKGSTSITERFPRVTSIDEGPILQPGKARNLGAEGASGDVLIFLDDDCEAQSDWIEESLAELSNPSVGAVSGMIKGKSSALFARCVDYANFGQCQTEQRWEGRQMGSWRRNRVSGRDCNGPGRLPTGTRMYSASEWFMSNSAKRPISRRRTKPSSNCSTRRN